MRRIPAPTEIAGYAIFAILGLYMLYKATTGQNLTVLLAGTLCFVLGLMALIFGVRNAIWHRQMLRQSPLHQNSEEK